MLVSKKLTDREIVQGIYDALHIDDGVALQSFLSQLRERISESKEGKEITETRIRGYVTEIHQQPRV
jgi:DNA-binding response OmpR family regulator